MIQKAKMLYSTRAIQWQWSKSLKQLSSFPLPHDHEQTSTTYKSATNVYIYMVACLVSLVAPWLSHKVGKVSQGTLSSGHYAFSHSGCLTVAEMTSAVAVDITIVSCRRDDQQRAPPCIHGHWWTFWCLDFQRSQHLSSLPPVHCAHGNTRFRGQQCLEHIAE